MATYIADGCQIVDEGSDLCCVRGLLALVSSDAGRDVKRREMGYLPNLLVSVFPRGDRSDKVRSIWGRVVVFADAGGQTGITIATRELLI